ncbi:MAG TPA: helix-turn-helix transcriptional regulator [Gammaproteobacteria bacterium]|nr:helix-turn-helix transcriptional regulator [Gammaproteobacteria bacterium]
MTTKRTHEQLKNAALKKPSVKKAYDDLKTEFDLYEKMIDARMKAKKSQSDVAKEMKTSTSAVGRLETAGGKLNHSPTLATLLNYAHAVGCELEITFKPIKHAHKHNKSHEKYT